MPAWKLDRMPAERRLVVTFEGRLTKLDGLDSAEAFARALGDGFGDVVWDVRRMNGYESAARVAWQNALWPLREQITHITVVGGNPLVRLGASTLGLFLGVPITFRDAS